MFIPGMHSMQQPALLLRQEHALQFVCDMTFSKIKAKIAKSGENWAEMPLLFNVIIFAVPADYDPWPTLALTWC